MQCITFCTTDLPVLHEYFFQKLNQRRKWVVSFRGEKKNEEEKISKCKTDSYSTGGSCGLHTFWSTCWHFKRPYLLLFAGSFSITSQPRTFARRRTPVSRSAPAGTSALSTNSPLASPLKLHKTLFAYRIFWIDRIVRYIYHETSQEWQRKSKNNKT